MKVKFFGGLRKAAGAAELHESGATIGEVLEKLTRQNEALAAAIFTGEDGKLQPHVRVIVNGIDSEFKMGLETPVSDDDQLAVVPPIGGG
jgi:molybdopterin synthase sulfur carrier subunit